MKNTDFYIFLIAITELLTIFKYNIFFLTSERVCIYIDHTIQQNTNQNCKQKPIGLLNSPKNPKKGGAPPASPSPRIEPTKKPYAIQVIINGGKQQ